MDVVNNARSFLNNWQKGGETECRNSLLAAYSGAPNTASTDLVVTTCHALLTSLLQSRSFSRILNATSLVSFLRSVVNGLPSSSVSTGSNNAFLFGEQLVDMIWSVDAELDEAIVDAKAIVTVSGDQAASDGGESSTLAVATKAKENAEHDKKTLVEVLKMLLAAGIVDPTVCRERLDVAIIVNAGLMPDKSAYDKKEIRTRTHLFYRQNKFNLLREQSEGYSKLNAELTSNLGPPHSNTTGQPLESYASISERARVVWQKVISLIGYFDLDPNRALDIILDVYSVHLGTHYTFFSALLSFSPWAGLYKAPTPGVEDQPMAQDYEGKTLDEILASLDPTPVRSAQLDDGARVLAQVLGFKFAYYQSLDVSEATPKQLYLTTALLIREGFIALEDIYPHLTPFDDDMDRARKDYLASIQSRIQGAKSSILAMAAPLESSSSSSKPKAPSEAKAEAKTIPNQRASLLSALLAVGALRPAFALMSKYPWLVDAHPEIADLIIQIMKHSINPLYQSVIVTKEPRPSFNQPKARYGPTGLIATPPRKSILSLWAPTPPSTSTADFVFFFPRWIERVPVCSSLQDLIDVVEPLMRFIGAHVSRDPTFLTKFMRLARMHLQSTVPVNEAGKRVGDLDEGNPICAFWYTVARTYLLPALSLIRGNAVFTVEVWSIIRLFSNTSRWRLYGEWRNVYKTHPELRIREIQCNREAKGILRRLAHDSVDSLAGPVAKLAHSNPSIFFTNAINQIMSYDNMAEVVIQVLRYVTNMGFEVLVYVLLDALSHPTKPRVKDDGVNTSDWLQNLASFTGMLFRRYSTDLTPVLNYLVHQLYAGQTTEIIVLRELILKMAGIEPLPDLSDQQVVAMAGGPALRIEAVASKTRGARLDPGDAILKGPQRLGRFLLDSSLALPLLIQVAQQRQACVFKAQNAHLKSLAGLYDNTHGVLCQYLELLTTPNVVPPQEYATKVLPTLGELGQLYGICPSICMQIIRPVLHASLLASTLSLSTEETEKRLKAEMVARKKPIPSRVASPAGNPDTKPQSTEEGDTKPAAETAPANDENAMVTDSTTGTPAPSAPPAPQSPWLPELAALFDDVRKIVPSQVLDVIGVGFYTTFWQLSTYDLSPPLSKYEEEMASLKAASRAEDLAIVAADRSPDRSTRLRAALHRQRRDRLNIYAQTLSLEVKEQSIMRTFTIRRMSREKHHWFSHTPKAATFAMALIEYCLQPRCLLSPMDADFCAQIIKVLHVQGTPGFPALSVYDKLLSDHIKVVVFSCSEYEARNYGRFLKGILTDLFKWYQDEQAYIQDCRTKSGGRTILHPGFQHRFNHKSPLTPEDLLKWTDFKRALKKWHTKLAKSLVECIQMKDFMHVYNAILVLKELLPVFPLLTVNECGRLLHDAVEQLLETEERGDLKIICTTYLSSLKSRHSLWARPKIPQPNGTSTPSAPAAQSTNTSVNGSSATNGRNSTPIVAPTPLAPRAQHANPDRPSSGMSSAKIAMENIPRPEVVKRVRTEPRGGPSPQPPNDVRTQTPTFSPQNSSPISAVDARYGDALRQPGSPRVSSPLSAPDAARHSRQESGLSKDISRSSTPAQAITGSASLPPSQLTSEGKPDSMVAMPPPSIPSQTMSAQELRETAKQSMNRTVHENTDDRNRLSTDNRPQPSASLASPSSARRRSTSPPSRPGTRNVSSDSRNSGGRPRSDRGDDTKRSERDGRLEHREHSSSTVARRDSLTHSRRDRHRDGEREDKDRERDRGRDRHGDREREKDRDKGERDRERDKDRERDRDRHLRDEKDRDRDARKDREPSIRAPTAPTAPEDRSLPTRPDSTRHRDDGGGGLKRRRPYEEEADRGSKRSARKDHRDDRGRRSEKEGSDRRDSDRRRKDRDDIDDKPPTPGDKPAERRIPDAPSSSKVPLPPSTPLGPRAMTDSRLSGGRDRMRDPPSAPNGHAGGPDAGGLRSRIADREIRTSLGGPSQSPQQTSPSTPYPRSGPPGDDRDGARKRTLSERDRDLADSTSGDNLGSQPPKRPKLKRDRYAPPSGLAPSGLAKKTLPIAPNNADKRGRKD